MASVYENITNQIVKLIEENRILPWQKPWSTTFPTNTVSGRPYRGINAVILAATKFADQRWLTFRQAQELGGHVRKGEKSTQVTLWKFQDDVDEDERQKKLAPLVRAYAVFNVGQCDGLELPPVIAKSIAAEPFASADDLLAGYVGGPRVVHGGDTACYIPSSDRVNMPSTESFCSSERYFGVLAHELVHSSGAAKRLARRGVMEPIHFGSESYAQEELVAEIGAAFLAAEFGIDNTVEASASYIDGWLNALKRDNGLIIRAAGQAQKAADWVLGRRFLAPQTEA